MSAIGEIWQTQIRLLTFRSVSPDLKNRLGGYLLYTLFITWIVGLGRYWDHPNAAYWQYAGLGSLAYIFVLSAFLWVIVLPLQPQNWQYRSVLIFVGLTSLPAVLYAIPVERYLSLEQAQSVNAAFLGIVALWRVALYVRFLRVGAGLSFLRVIVATLLPLSAIVLALSMLNLEHVVFDLMAGIRQGSESPYDAAYGVVVTLSVFSYLAFPFTVVLYLFAIYYKRTVRPG